MIDLSDEWIEAKWWKNGVYEENKMKSSEYVWRGAFIFSPCTARSIILSSLPILIELVNLLVVATPSVRMKHRHNNILRTSWEDADWWCFSINMWAGGESDEWVSPLSSLEPILRIVSFETYRERIWSITLFCSRYLSVPGRLFSSMVGLVTHHQ